MTATNEQIIEEAHRRQNADVGKQELLSHYIIEVTRENWTPPEPVVDPDLLAFREWETISGCDDRHRKSVLAGNWDHSIRAKAYLAGARMAREREQERAKGLVDRLSDLVERVTHDGKRDYVTGVNAGEMISARVVLAKYRGEA